jgi:hypothetical protein
VLKQIRRDTIALPCQLSDAFRGIAHEPPSLAASRSRPVPTKLTPRRPPAQALDKGPRAEENLMQELAS